MTEHLLKAVLSQGSSALGRFVRLWLLSLLIAGTGFAVLAANVNPDLLVAEVIVSGFVCAFFLAIPMAVVVAILIVAFTF